MDSILFLPIFFVVSYNFAIFAVESAHIERDVIDERQEYVAEGRGVAKPHGSPALEVLCDEIAQLALWGVQAGLSFYSIVIYTASSLSLAWMNFTMRRWSQMREFTTMPTFIFSPTSMQPWVSLAVLPAWMRTPEKPGTPRSNDSHFLKRIDLVITSG